MSASTAARIESACCLYESPCATAACAASDTGGSSADPLVYPAGRSGGTGTSEAWTGCAAVCGKTASGTGVDSGGDCPPSAGVEVCGAVGTGATCACNPAALCATDCACCADELPNGRNVLPLTL